MKKIYAALSFLLILCMFSPIVYSIPFKDGINTESSSQEDQCVTISPSQIVSETAILMEADTGQILFDKDMDRQMYPASLTKIMTAILALENGKMDDMLTVDQEIIDDVYSYGYETSHIALTVGERISLKDALYASLLESANDATALIAKYIGGSLDHFVEMMNEKAKEIGAIHTHFVNSHGLHDDNHYTTAYDLALILKYALTVPDFETFISTDQYTMEPTNNQEDYRYFWNQNQMIQDSYYYDEDVVGGKLGWTEEATNTMAVLGERNGRRLICVLLKSVASNAKYNDCELLLDYGFENFKDVSIDVSNQLPKGVDVLDENGELRGDVTISTPPQIDYLIHNDLSSDDVEVSIDIPEHYVLGETVKAQIIIKPQQWVQCMPDIPLTIPLDTKSNFNANAMSVTNGMKNSSAVPFLWIGIGILVALIVFIILLFVIRSKVRKKMRKRYAIDQRKVYIDRRIRRRL